MVKSPKIPIPTPPALPATFASGTPAAGPSPFAKLAGQVGIFTSMGGLTSPASTQKRSLIGG